MDKYLYNEFENYFPFVANKVVECFDGGPFELIAKLNDGRIVSYYGVDRTIRNLPKDASSLTEEQCQKEFGIRLYRLMYNKGITQSELSERSGITQSSISNYITGKKTPSFYTVDKIARALDCSIEDLRCKY